MKIQFTALLGMLFFFVASCAKPMEAPKAIDMDKLKMDIQAMEDAYAAGEKAKDADAVVAYYSDDAISYGRDEEPTSGKAAIKEKMLKGFAKDTIGESNVYKIVDLFVEGNMVVEIGSSVVLDSTGKEVRKGHYMSYFQMKDGKYHCVRDMSASSMPKKEGM